MASLALLLAVAACAVPVSSSERGSRDDSPGSSGNRNTTGELKPPEIGDEQAVKRPPQEASNQPMPVIPPPGTPGGNPNLRPK